MFLAVCWTTITARSWKGFEKKVGEFTSKIQILNHVRNMADRKRFVNKLICYLAFNLLTMKQVVDLIYSFTRNDSRSKK